MNEKKDFSIGLEKVNQEYRKLKDCLNEVAKLVKSAHIYTFLQQIFSPSHYFLHPTKVVYLRHQDLPRFLQEQDTGRDLPFAMCRGS